MRGSNTVIMLVALFLASCGSEKQQDSIATPILQEDPATKNKVKTTETGFAIPKGKPGTPVMIEASTVKWTGSKPIGDSFSGTIDIQRGKVGFDENGKLESALLTIDMTSIKASDLNMEENETGPARLSKHLMSEDFFYAEKYPIAVLQILDVEPVREGNGGTYICFGEMTIKDITKAVNMRVHVQEEKNVRVIKCNFGMDRSLWNVRYNSGQFFEDLGDALINDIIEIEATIVVLNR